MKFCSEVDGDRRDQAQGFLSRTIFFAQTAGSTATLFTLSFIGDMPGGDGRTPIFRKRKFNR